MLDSILRNQGSNGTYEGKIKEKPKYILYNLLTPSLTQNMDLVELKWMVQCHKDVHKISRTSLKYACPAIQQIQNEQDNFLKNRYAYSNLVIEFL